MADAFDPYHKWLAIPPEDQPLNAYRLLGVKVFESDPDVISNAADARMAHVRTFQAGKHSALSQKLLNELSTARVLLLDPAKRAAYDQTLRAATPRPMVVPVGVVAPVTAQAAPVAPFMADVASAVVGREPVLDFDPNHVLFHRGSARRESRQSRQKVAFEWLLAAEGAIGSFRAAPRPSRERQFAASGSRRLVPR
jgi:curved DNA-binding protein CbpA